MKKLISLLLVITFVLSAIVFTVPASAYITGDLNGDGRVNAKDASLLSQVLLGTEKGTVAGRMADIDGDGRPNAADVGLLARYFVGDYDLRGFKTVFSDTKAITYDETVNSVMEEMEAQADEFDSFELREARTVIYADTLGLVKDDPASSAANSQKINAAISSAPENSALVFSGGTYYINNNISVSNKNGFILKGNGAKLVNTGYNAVAMEGSGTIWSVSGCNNLTIDGFEIDFYHQVQICGTVEKIAKRYTYIRPYEQFVNGEGRLPLEGGEKLYAAHIVYDDGTPGDEHYFTDGRTQTINLEKADGAGEEGLFKYNYSGLGAKGAKIAVRLSQSGSIASVTNTNVFTLRNVTVRSNPGAGVGVSGDCSDFCFDGFSFLKEEGSEALFASNVDCIHFSNGLRGKFILRNCTFDGLGDDALNVNSRRAVTKYFDETNPNKFTPIVPDFYTQADGYVSSGWCKVGDTLVFNAADLHEIGTARVTAFDGRNITVDRMPEGISNDCFVQNESLAPFVVIKNCEMAHGRARGLLLQAKNVLFENCNFHDMRLAAILIAPDYYYWGESGFTDNVLIKNCTFENVCKQMTSYGAIMISASHDGGDVAGKDVTTHKNISIVNNTFRNMDTAAVYARTVANLKMEDNEIVNCAAELRQGLFKDGNDFVTPVFATSSYDMSRTMEVHAVLGQNFEFVCLWRDGSSGQQRYNLQAKSIKLEGNGKTVVVNSGSAVTEKGSDFDLTTLTFNALDKIPDLKEMVKGDSVRITVSGTCKIEDVSSPYRDTTVEVSCNITVTGNDFTTLRDAVNICG